MARNNGSRIKLAATLAVVATFVAAVHGFGFQVPAGLQQLMKDFESGMRPIVQSAQYLLYGPFLWAGCFFQSLANFKEDKKMEVREFCVEKYTDTFYLLWDSPEKLSAREEVKIRDPNEGKWEDIRTRD